MSIKLVDTLESMGNFPVANASGVQFTDGESLQKKLDDGSLGGGSTYVELSQDEYDALPDDDTGKLDGQEYRTYDTGNIYKNGILYGGKEPIELTFTEYKELETNGLIDPDTDYIITQDGNGILLEGSDIAYDNSASGLEATNVQGAIDKVSENVDILSNSVFRKVDGFYVMNNTAQEITLKNGGLYMYINAHINNFLEIVFLTSIVYDGLDNHKEKVISESAYPTTFTYLGNNTFRIQGSTTSSANTRGFLYEVGGARTM